MEAPADAVIISAFGRGNWLAQELARQGWRTSLVDTSGQFGPWQPEDIEGPFGLFETDFLDPDLRASLVDAEKVRACERGFTIWLKDGPFEMRSPLTSFRARQLQVPDKIMDYLSSRSRPLEKQQNLQSIGLRKQSFDQSWILHLSHQLAATTFRYNHEACEQGDALPLLAPYYLRQPTALKMEQALKSCEDQKVRVYKRARVTQVQAQGSTVQSVTVESEGSAAMVLQSRVFIWVLTSEETQKFPENVGHVLFPKGAVKAAWAWQRFRFELSSSPILEQIPDSVLLLENLHFPWTHENMILMLRSQRERCFDLWLRLPTVFRFDRGYLEQMSKKITHNLLGRLPSVHIEGVQLPTEVTGNYGTLSAPRHPIYSEEDAAKLSFGNMRNLFHCHPETWSRSDYLGKFMAQTPLREKLMKLKMKWDAEALKQQRRIEKNTGVSP